MQTVDHTVQHPFRFVNRCGRSGRTIFTTKMVVRSSTSDVRHTPIQKRQRGRLFFKRRQSNRTACKMMVTHTHRSSGVCG